MPQVPFDQLPSDARLWIFPAARPLNDEERRRVLAEADAFIDRWMAHGVPLTAGRDLRHNQFVLVGVNERAAGVSGCSVDALVRRMDQLGRELGVDLVDNAPVQYREGNTITRVSRDEFSSLVSKGAVNLDTVVFDNTVTKVGDVDRWEVRAADAWHARAVF
jgi:hypothetical protein